MIYCKRCGQPKFRRDPQTHRYYCQHMNTGGTNSSSWALRIQAAYALGKVHNPEHDTTDYAEQTRHRGKNSRRRQPEIEAVTPS